MEPRYFIVFEGGPRQGEKIPIQGPKFTIGRKPENHLVLTDNKASGQHAEIALEASGPVLRDLGSTNGTVLDGRKIEEVPLSNNDNITIGETFFRFVDSEAVELPAVHHLQVDDKNKKKIPVVPILLILVLGTAAYFYFSGPTTQANTIIAVTPIPGNLIKGGSFESSEGETASSAWQLQDGSPESFSISVEKKTGSSGLSANFSDPSYARATISQPIQVEAMQKFRLAGWVSFKGEDAAASLLAVFRSSTDPRLEVIRSIAWKKSGERGFTRLEGEVESPVGADRVSISCIAVSGSKNSRVSFDDLEFVKLAAASAPSYVNGEYKFDLNPISSSLHKIDSNLFQSLGFVFSEESQSYPGSLFLNPEQNGASLMLPNATGGKVEAGKLAFNFEKKDNGAELVYSLSELRTGLSAALQFQVLANYFAEEGVLVLKEKQNAKFTSDFSETAVQSLVFGEERNRLQLRFSAPVSVKGRNSTAGFTIEIAVQEKCSVFFQVSFEEEKRRANDLILEAKKKEEQGTLGAALLLYGKILNEFPFDKRTVEKARDRYDKIFQEGMSKIARVERHQDDARFFALRDGFRIVKKAAKGIAKDYEGTEIGDRATTVLNNVDGDLKKVEIVLDREESSRLRAMASSFEAVGNKKLSQEILRYLGSNYTEASEEKKP